MRYCVDNKRLAKRRSRSGGGHRIEHFRCFFRFLTGFAVEPPLCCSTVGVRVNTERWDRSGSGTGRTHPHSRAVDLLEVLPRLRTRLDEPASQAPCQLLPMPRLDLALVHPVNLVPDEHDRDPVRVFDARDLPAEFFDAVE